MITIALALGCGLFGSFIGYVWGREDGFDEGYVEGRSSR